MSPEDEALSLSEEGTNVTVSHSLVINRDFKAFKLEKKKNNQLKIHKD